ncbi:MAG: HD domain-containing protein [Fidelibacterota bacterium]
MSIVPEQNPHIEISAAVADIIRKWFSGYVAGFKEEGEELRQNIVLKEEHTGRVCREILQIGKQLDLNDDELRLAEITALLHDVGRFEQYARYHTFVDKKSEDHAELGIKILRKYGILDQFNEFTRNLIYRTIRYHNQASLPQHETEECLLFTKLLRDVDKLDIWKVVSDYYHRKDGGRNGALELDLPDTPEISEQVYRDLVNQRIVDVKHIRNLNDFKLLQMGWIFDVNFSPTLRSVKSRGYLERIRDVLPNTEKIRTVYNVVQAYLDHRLSEIQEEVV